MVRVMQNATELVKEIQEMRDQGFLSDALLRHAVKKLKRASEKYDWVGVYLLNEAGDELWLHNYVGSPSEHSRIPVGSGVCGTAVAEKANQNIPDVSAVDNYLACSPEVQSELVVLIRAGDEIFGQIDIDSDEKGAFGTEDEAGVQAVADKLAEQIAAERR
jgi:L-methionine (R)-S-oxide reductase